MSKYYIAYTPDKIIWGIGTEAKETLKDASEYLYSHCEGYKYLTNDLKVISCTKELFDLACDIGGELKDIDRQYYWDVDDGVARIAGEEQSDLDLTISVYRELLTGCIEHIVRGDPITDKDWDQMCLLTGRYCEPFLKNPTTKND